MLSGRISYEVLKDKLTAGQAEILVVLSII
jgi:hypothetical protein